MKISLKNAWFDPSATYRPVGEHDGIPEDWEDKLPKDAEILEESPEKKPTPKKILENKVI